MVANEQAASGAAGAQQLASMCKPTLTNGFTTSSRGSIGNVVRAWARDVQNADTAGP